MVETTPQSAIYLSRDTSPENQPENSSRAIINMVNISDEGDMYALVSEGGTDPVAGLPGNPLGTISVGPFKTVYFTDDNSISVYDESTEELTVIVSKLAGLNFSSPIQGVYSQVRGCEDIIYWNDHNNSDRYFNLTRPEKFQNDSGLFDIDLFGINFNATNPTLSFSLLENGGQLDLGLYYPVVEYVDDFENVLFKSEPFQIYLPVGIDSEGGYNIENYLPEQGGVNLSPKSIQTDITNINEEVSFIRLSFIIFRNGDGFAPTAITLGRLYPVENGVAKVTFGGFSVNRGDYIRDVGDLTSAKFFYDSSRAMEIVHNRLLRGNLKEKERDYSTYQKFASKICKRFLVKQIDKEDYINNRSEIGGEKKADAIAFIHKDGSISPPFFIPTIQQGINTTVLKQYQIVITTDDQPCTDDIYFIINYSIGGESLSKVGSIPQGGRLVYLTSDQPITDVTISKFSNGPFVSKCGTELSAEVVIISVSSENEAYLESVNSGSADGLYSHAGQFGVYFSEEEYQVPPNYDCKDDDFWGVDCNGNSLVGTKVSYRVNPDRTLIPLFDENYVYTIGVEFSNIEYPNNDIVGHFFLTSTYETRTIEAKGMLIPYAYAPQSEDNIYDYTEGRYIHNIENNKPTSVYYDTINPYTKENGSGVNVGDITQATPSTTNYGYNFISADYLFLNNVPQGTTISIEGYYEEVRIALQDRRIDDFWESSLPYDHLDQNFKPHEFPSFTSFSSRIDVDLEESISLPPRSTFGSVRNFSHTSKFNILRTTSRIDETNPFIYVSIRRDINPFPSVHNVPYRLFSSNPNENVIFNGDGFVSPIDLTNISWFNATTSVAKVEFEYLKDIYVESVVNCHLRHNGSTDETKYYEGDIEGCYEFMRRRYSEEYLGGLKLVDSFPPEWYGYNRDYTPSYNLKVYYPLEFLFDYCSPCNATYPNYLIYSEQSFSTSRANGFKVFLPNNFQALSSEKGGIMAVDYQDTTLVVRTEYSCFFLKPNPQQINTSDSTVFIGTSGFLSIPPQEIITTDVGYGGQQHPHESASTDHGLFWVDRNRKMILSLGGKLDRASDRGLRQWLYKYMPDDKPIRVAHDVEFERILFFKEDSWTLSFDAKSNQFLSWHTYLSGMPSFSSSGMYSVNNLVIWKHNSKTTNKIYNQDRYSSCEILLKNPVTFNVRSFRYYAKVQEYINGQWAYILDETFNEALFYNENQSTGLITMTLGQGEDHDYSPFNKRITRTDRNYKVSQIFDQSNGAPVNSELFNDSTGEWLDVQSNVVSAKDQVDQGTFRGKWICCKLFYRPSNERRRIIFFFSNTLKEFKQR